MKTDITIDVTGQALPDDGTRVQGQLVPTECIEDPEPVDVPSGYEIWQDGVYSVAVGCKPLKADRNKPLPRNAGEGRKRIAMQPAWVSGLGMTVDTEEPLVRLTYQGTDKLYRSMWVDRSYTTDRTHVITLGKEGLPINSLNANSMIAYFAHGEAANSHRKKLLIGHRSGIYEFDGKPGVLLGNTWIGPPGTMLTGDPRSTRFSNAFALSGSWEVWRGKWLELWSNPTARWVIAAAFLPLLMKYLSLRNFVVHLWGESGFGKSAIGRFAISVWGDPKILVGSFNRTEISNTEIFHHITDLPVMVDELQLAKGKLDPEAFIYQVCQPEGRERAQRTGGLQQVQRWNTVVITTGEEPLVQQTDLGGQNNRVIELNTAIFNDKEAAASLYATIEANYGHAGQRFATELVRVCQDNGTDWLKHCYQFFVERLAQRHGGGVTNHVKYAAGVAASGFLSALWVLGIPKEEAIEKALEDGLMVLRACATMARPSLAQKALALLHGHKVAHPGDYGDATAEEGMKALQNRRKLIGYETREGMVYIPIMFEKILKDDGLVGERVLADFARNGWLVEGNGGNNHRVYLSFGTAEGETTTIEAIVIKREFFFGDGLRIAKEQERRQLEDRQPRGAPHLGHVKRGDGDE